MPGRGDGASDGHVAGFEPAAAAVGVFDVFFLRGFGVAPVLFEDGGAAELDLSVALFAVGVEFCAGEDDFVSFRVDEADLDGGEGPADAAVYAVGGGEPAGEGHADFGHAVAFEEDVVRGEVGPGIFGRRGERRAARDVEAEVWGGDAFFCCGLEL